MPQDTWLAVRDLFSQLIRPAKGWEDADIIAEPAEMAQRFRQAYPEKKLFLEDMRLALHDLNISFERNEHNDKFYYLASYV